MKKSTRGHMRKSDGHYHINGKKYSKLIGSRAQVYHTTAYKTSGGLTKAKLHMNKHGRIVSAIKHKTAKKEKRLEKAGYKPKKGKFIAMKKSMKKPIKGRKHKTRKN